jgi:hypothetical protein
MTGCFGVRKGLSRHRRLPQSPIAYFPVKASVKRAQLTLNSGFLALACRRLGGLQAPRAGSLRPWDQRQQAGSKEQQAGQRPSSRSTLSCGHFTDASTRPTDPSTPYEKEQCHEQDSQIRRSGWSKPDDELCRSCSEARHGRTDRPSSPRLSGRDQQGQRSVLGNCRSPSLRTS